MGHTVWQTIRPLNCLLAAFGVLIGAAVANFGLALSVPVLTAMIAAFLVCAGGQTINDYFDFAVDKRKGRHQFEDRNHYLWLSLALFAAGNALSWTLNGVAFQIAGAITILLVVYSGLLHRYKVFGNMVVALGTALPLIFGATVFGHYQAIIFLAGAAFLVNWAREIVKDVQDESANRGRKVTLPMLIRAHIVNTIMFILVIAAILVAFLPVVFDVFGNFWYMVLVGVASILFLKAAWELREFKPKASQTTFKIAMAVALIGFLAGTL
jgi:geranylgeranylglycerol-phosphate geranylgeranyltransferase